MNREIFTTYMNVFEREVIVKGVKDGVFGSSQIVSMRPGKLANSKFGEIVGSSFYCDELELAIDYYGHIKRSTGLLRLRKKLSGKGQVRRVSCILVHFASLRIDRIANVCNDPQAIGLFPLFKETMIKMRGFRK